MKYENFEVKINVKMANQPSHLFSSNFHISLAAGPYYVGKQNVICFKIPFRDRAVVLSMLASFAYPNPSRRPHKMRHTNTWLYVIVANN